MTGPKQANKRKKSLAKSSKTTLKHVAVVMDAWFPGSSRGPGVVGGGQVHVRELTRKLEEKYQLKFTLFYPAHPHIVYRLFWTLIVVGRIVQHHKKHPFQIIHSHGFNSGAAAAMSGKLTKVPVIHTVHGSHLMDLKSKTIKAWLEKWALTKIEYAKQISVASTFLKYPNVNKEITIIPNGVNVSDFDAVDVDKNTNPTLIWVGRNDPSKGMKYLKQAIVKLRKKVPDLKSKLVTGGQLTGASLIKAYKRSHVFVLPSLAEGQPITLLEAWAAKLPVVVTDVGDNKDMVKDGINGYVIEPGNVNQLTNAILKVLRARTKNTQMGENGYNLVKHEYTWDKVAEKTWDVYQKVLNLKS